MSLDFYDSKGHQYAYTDDGETIFTLNGRPVAYFDEGSIYSFTGVHLGFLENGQVWDHSGSVLLFTEGSIGGPMKPLRTLSPLKGLKQMKPLKGIKQLKPLKPLKGMGWSNLSPQSVFEG